MIAAEQVRKIYPTRRGEVASLDGINFTAEAGEMVCVTGPSGCGKTTLLLTLGGMLRPTSGRVRFGAEDLYARTPAQLAAWRRAEVGFIFQLFHLIPYLSAADNARLAAPSGESEWTERVRKALTGLGLARRLDHSPGALSIGERQRVALVRATLLRPKLVLADEPTGNLDPENAAEVLRSLRALADAGSAVVVVTHGTEAAVHATRVVAMREGRMPPTDASIPTAAAASGSGG